MKQAGGTTRSYVSSTKDYQRGPRGTIKAVLSSCPQSWRHAQPSQTAGEGEGEQQCNNGLQWLCLSRTGLFLESFRPLG